MSRGLNMKVIFPTFVFGFHVNFQGCNIFGFIPNSCTPEYPLTVLFPPREMYSLSLLFGSFGSSPLLWIRYTP